MIITWFEKDGKVIHFIGDESGVSIKNCNFDGAHILHNHPDSNGIVSFGEDDFSFLRDNQSISFYCVNAEYDYIIKVLKPIDEVVYHDLYIVALMNYDILGSEDIQDCTMRVLTDMGYVKYEKKRIM